MARDHRRLAAIVSADVVGYSLLMGRDDSATLAGLKAHRRELIDPKIAEYGGRIVKTTGDGLLLEFPSVVDAVRCAVDIQRGMAERNVGVPPEQRIDFRIGINVGDIIIDGDDIFGDGVNVAARLQTLAEPGGICASGVVRDQVLDKLSFTFEALGAQEVKNIARSVDAYRVDLGTGSPQTQGRGRRRWRRLTRAARLRWVATGALALGLAAIGVWVLPQFSKTAPTPPAASIAILPFAAPAGSVAEARLADTLTQELTSAFQRRARWARVVSHSLAASYKGQAIDARAVGRELNVRYVVEGELHRAGEQIVVNVQLINADNATQAWSDHIDLEQSQVAPDIGDLIVQLTQRLASALSNAESRRIGTNPAAGASATDLVLRAINVMKTGSDPLQAALEARKLSDEALRLDPNLLLALLVRGSTLQTQLEMDPHADHDRLVEELDVLSNRAVAVSRDDQRAWQLRAVALVWQGRLETALEANAESARLDPKSAGAIVQRAALKIAMGQSAETLELIDKAIALDPKVVGALNTLGVRCDAFLRLGRYDDAIAACSQAEAQNDSWEVHLLLVAAFAQKGEAARAADEKTMLLKLRPGYTIAEFKALNRKINNPIYLQQTETHLFAGLRKAGIPEQ